ncbi:MAG: hypothetical protein ABI904_09350 [Chloroflexota bacterium]
MDTMVKSIHKALLIFLFSFQIGCSVSTQITLEPSISIPTSTPTPERKLQLTFVVTNSIYAIDVGCLDAPEPCFSTPKKLLDIESVGLKNSWSPDGMRVAFGWGEIYIADWEGEDQKNITNTSDFNTWPIWSTDGNHIVYESKSSNGQFTFFMASLDGSGIRQLLTSMKEPLNPTFPELSPNGAKIVFDARPVSDPQVFLPPKQIFVSNLDGSALNQITYTITDPSFTPPNNITPSFSPDGKYILFNRFTNYADIEPAGLSDIYTLDLETKKETRLNSDDQRNMSLPVWSPVGNWIATVSYQNGNKDIYLIRADGTKVINVTKSQQDEDLPAWRYFTTP